MLYINYSIPKFAYDHQKELRLRIIKNFLYNNLNLSSNELVQLTTGTFTNFFSTIHNFNPKSNIICFNTIFYYSLFGFL